MDTISNNKKWYKILNKEESETYPIKKITKQRINDREIALTRLDDGFFALDNACVHQGGPLGEGSWDKQGYLICPWHAFQYDPRTGKAPPGYDDCVNKYNTKLNPDGLYVELPSLPQIYTISDQIVEVLVEWKVNCIFGMIGHSNLAMGEALRKRKKDIKFISVRHEGAASFAASAYGKLTGEPGVCLSIAGPGATNLLTGLYDAKLDRAPVIALTGQIETQFLGPGAFQEVDLMGAFDDVVIWHQTVLKSENASQLTALAIKHSILERNVTQLSIPDEIQKSEGKSIKEPRKGRIPSKKIHPDPQELQRAVDLLNNAKKPCIIVGHGGKNFRSEIQKLAEKIDATVVTTFKAKGAISDSHRLGAGVLGSSGTPVGSAQVLQADILLVLGSSFSEKTSIPPKVIIQVDFDPIILNKRKSVTVPLWSEIGSTVAMLCDKLDPKTRPEIVEDINKRKKEWKLTKSQRAVITGENGAIHPALVFEHLTELIPEDAVITVDVGNNAYSFGRYFECKNQEIVLSGYLGSIGYAFPAALGASLARPNKKVVAVAGDGGFGQYLGEFLTAVHYSLPITLILLNNNQIAKIANEQRVEQFPVFATDLTNPNFAEYATLCGGQGWRVTKANELATAMKKGLNAKTPSIVEIITDPNSA